MSVRDRILAACSGNQEQAELVLSQLERVRLLREKGRHPRVGADLETPAAAGAPPSALLPEQPCPNCLVAFEDSSCPICGRLQTMREAPTGARVEDGGLSGGSE